MPEYKKRRQSRKQGGDASLWAQQVYGDKNMQHAAPGSNAIAMTDRSTLNMDTYTSNSTPVSGFSFGGGVTGARNLPPPRASIKGGRTPKKGGRGIITDIAVPAILLYANNMIKPRKGSKTSKRFSKNKSRRA